MNTILLVLAPGSAESRVILNGVEITSCVHAVEVYQEAGSPVEVCLTLHGEVHLQADVERVQVRKDS